jgi:hypothetical protein
MFFVRHTMHGMRYGILRRLGTLENVEGPEAQTLDRSVGFQDEILGVAIAPSS